MRKMKSELVVGVHFQGEVGGTLKKQVFGERKRKRGK